MIQVNPIKLSYIFENPSSELVPSPSENENIKKIESEVNDLIKYINNITKSEKVDEYDRNLLSFTVSYVRDSSENPLVQLVENKLKSKLQEIDIALSSLKTTESLPITEEVHDLLVDLEKKTIKFENLLNPRILDNNSITPNLKQIQVYNQYADQTTGSGFELCGLHALKNACIALSCCSSAMAKEEIQSLFNDEEFFLKFYDAFCKPVIGESQKGKADISLPVLRSIIRHMAETDVEDEKLQEVKKMFVSNLDYFAILLTAEDSNTGESTLSFLDENQAKEIANLVRELKSDLPVTYFLVLGNEKFGHWYTEVIHIDGEKRSYLACDSINNHHSEIKARSELAKMTSVLEEELANPDKLMEKAFSLDAEALERYSAWINPDGSAAVDGHAHQLLDTTPTLLAEEGVHNGSRLSLTLHLCLRSFEIFQKAGWFSSNQLQHQLYIEQLKKMCLFLLKNTDGKTKDSIKEKLKTILSTIEVNQPKELIPSIFEEAKADLENMGTLLTPQEISLVGWTFKNIQTLYKEIPSIIQEPDETKRLNLINKKLGSGNAEKGFSSGSDPETIEASLMSRVQLLLLTYQKAKADNDLVGFFKCFSKGDRCLNNRMENLIKYRALHSNIVDIDRVVNWDKIYELPSTVISDAIQECIDEEDLSKETGINIENYQDLTLAIFENKTFAKICVKYLKQYQNAALSLEFIKFLKEQGLSQEESGAPNWKVLLPEIIKLDRFPTMLKKGINLVDADL